MNQDELRMAVKWCLENLKAAKMYRSWGRNHRWQARLFLEQASIIRRTIRALLDA